MKLWITGKNGLLGNALCEIVKAPFVATGSEVDIGDLEALKSFARQNPGITHIVNCAAFSLVDASESRRDDAFRANALGPENLGRIAKEIGARLVHISTDYVFPGNLKRPLKETDPLGPLNYYGQTKLEGEEGLRKVFPSACIIRTSWIFGKGGKNFVGKLLQMFQEKEEIKLTADQWGRPTYVLDLARAILEMLDVSGLFQYANAGEATKFTFGCAMRDFAEKLSFPLRAPSLVAVPGSFFASPCKRPPYSVFDTAKIEAHLKEPIRPWQDALYEYLCTCAPSKTS